MSSSTPEQVPRLKLVAAFLSLYVIWGSTYLAIRFAIETLPPFLMAGVRFLVAGLIMYVWARATSPERPTRPNWVAATIVGGCLLLGGNGGVVWSEQFVPSGLAALLVATGPLWIVLIGAFAPGGSWPRPATIGGILLGLGGLGILVGPGDLTGAVGLIPILVLLLACLSWSVGSLYSRYAPLPRSPILATGMEMLTGGALLVAVGLLSGEASRVDVSAFSARSLLAVLYLIVFGSIVGFTSYIWLLRVTTLARATTYAYVNPVVAVLLGWAFAGEEITGRTLLAAAVIVASVVIITVTKERPAATASTEADELALDLSSPELASTAPRR